MLKKLNKYLTRPDLFAPSTSKFWDDEHISQEMLTAHFTSTHDGATRNELFVNQSVQWISNAFPSKAFPKLLDLGCGPGIYAEKFLHAGYQVTGIDFSKRSIDYAIQSAQTQNLTIQYTYENYLEMTHHEQFDLITLIWCDFCVLSPENRATLLKNIYHALKPNGFLIFDVFSSRNFDKKLEHTSYQYYDHSDFWSSEPHLCLNRLYKYESRVIVNQTVVITEDNTNCYNIWEHYFTLEEIENEVLVAKFRNLHFYSDIAGKEYDPKSSTICITAQK